MRNLLLLQSATSLRDYIELNLKAYHAVEIACVHDLIQATSLLENTKSFNAIYIDSSFALESNKDEFMAALKKFSSSQACEVFSSHRALASTKWVSYVPALSPAPKIVKFIEEKLGLPPKQISDSQYVAIPINCLHYVTVCPCPIFIRIGSGHDDAKYVKRFNINEAIEAKDIFRYFDKHIKEFYIAAENIGLIAAAIINHISSKITISDQHINHLQIAKEALSYGAYILKCFDIPTTHAQEIGEIIEKIITNVEAGDQRIARKFSKILASKEDFYHKHVCLTALISYAILAELQWVLSAESKSALTYAAYFQNFFLHQEEDIICVSETQLDQLDCSKKKELILNHALLAAEFIKTIPAVPYDVQKLILEQHGSHTGSGFPAIKKNSTQLSNLFMVATEFSHNLLIHFESDSPIDIKAVLLDAQGSYGSENHKIMEALERNFCSLNS